MCVCIYTFSLFLHKKLCACYTPCFFAFINTSHVMTLFLIDLQYSLGGCILIFLPHMVWHTIVGQMYIRNGCIFLENQPLYHYVIPFFSPGNCTYFGVCSVWNEYGYSCFLLISISMVYFLLSSGSFLPLSLPSFFLCFVWIRN